MTAPALRLKGVRKRFGRRTALNGLDLSVPPDSVVGLVGENGAGKTTTFSIVMGYIRPDAGLVDIFGEGPFRPAQHRGRLSVLPQDAAVPPEATPLRWLSYLGTLQGLGRQEARVEAGRLLEELHLADRTDSPMRTLSHGMRKRVTLAQALIGDPRLILLDEPFSGIDPRESETLRTLLASLRKGRALLISSHDLAQIERTCDRVAFIRHGETVRETTLESIASAHRGRVVYRLARPPREASLDGLLPGASFQWDGRTGGLTCLLPPGWTDLAEANRILLPALIAQHAGILAVDPGNRIEAAYFEDTR